MVALERVASRSLVSRSEEILWWEMIDKEAQGGPRPRHQ